MCILLFSVGLYCCFVSDLIHVVRFRGFVDVCVFVLFCFVVCLFVFVSGVYVCLMCLFVFVFVCFDMDVVVRCFLVVVRVCYCV